MNEIRDSHKCTTYEIVNFTLHIISKVFLLPLFREVALEFLNTSIKMVRKLVEILIGKLGVTVEDSRIDALRSEEHTSELQSQ